MKKHSLPIPLERDIQAGIIDVCSLFPWLGIWRANTGAVKRENDDGSVRRVRFGFRGQSDILGIIYPTGRMVAIEVKRPGAYPTDEQRGFLKNIRDFGGFAVVVRDVDQMLYHLSQLDKDRSYTPHAKWLA